MMQFSCQIQFVWKIQSYFISFLQDRIYIYIYISPFFLNLYVKHFTTVNTCMCNFFNLAASYIWKFGTGNCPISFYKFHISFLFQQSYKNNCSMNVPVYSIFNNMIIFFLKKKTCLEVTYFSWIKSIFHYPPHFFFIHEIIDKNKRSQGTCNIYIGFNAFIIQTQNI